MYTLINGQKVKELSFRSSGVESWEISQYYWLDGKKVQQAYNTETGEIKILDAMGRELYTNSETMND